MENDALIVGSGYLGSRVAAAVNSQKNRIWTTTRSADRARSLADDGFQPLVVDWTDRRSLDALPEVGRILVAVSYDRNSRCSRHESQVGGLRNLLSVISPTADVCYISTTGVYHQRDGRWVDENSPTRPSREGGRVHLAAEQLLHRTRPDSPWTILRLAGIYGPGRVPRAADVIAGRAIQSPRDGYLNLIHVDDAVQAVIASWQQPSQRLYVVADDQPVVRGEFYCEIARQCHVSPPRFADPPPNAPVSMRSESNKRIWNRRFKRDLVPKLAYPTFRDGLAQILSKSNE